MTDTPSQRTDFAPRIPDGVLRGRDGEYLPGPGLTDAANVALALDRPLLLTGEPGCGKTDFAFVAANALAPTSGNGDRGGHRGSTTPRAAALDPRCPLECHIRSDARARDLLYHYDAILRFTEGHHGTGAAQRRAEDARHYIELQPLGIALMSSVRRVVLLDEIDKAPRDLPNDLLRELDRGEFEIAEIPMGIEDAPDVPDAPDAPDAPDTPDTLARPARKPVLDRTGVPLQRVMVCPKPRPFVVITSNVERQLPDPFLRRCVFFHIPFPDAVRLRDIVQRRLGGEDASDDPARARARPLASNPTFLDRVVHVFLAAREIPGLVKQPSTAELLDWVVALGMYDVSHIIEFIGDFAGAVTAKGLVRHASRRWTDLPAYGCLFKLREDRDAAAGHRTAPA